MCFFWKLKYSAFHRPPPDDPAVLALWVYVNRAVMPPPFPPQALSYPTIRGPLMPHALCLRPHLNSLAWSALRTMVTGTLPLTCMHPHFCECSTQSMLGHVQARNQDKKKVHFGILHRITNEFDFGLFPHLKIKGIRTIKTHVKVCYDQKSEYIKTLLF